MSELRVITCIVEKGKGDLVAKAAIAAGAKGATLTDGKGTGIRQSIMTVITPEKEVVTVVVRQPETDAVYNAMIKSGNLEKPGKGFIYVTRLEKAFGFLEDFPEGKIERRPPPSLAGITLSLESDK